MSSMRARLSVLVVVLGAAIAAIGFGAAWNQGNARNASLDSAEHHDSNGATGNATEVPSTVVGGRVELRLDFQHDGSVPVSPFQPGYYGLLIGLTADGEGWRSETIAESVTVQRFHQDDADNSYSIWVLVDEATKLRAEQYDRLSFSLQGHAANAR